LNRRKFIQISASTALCALLPFEESKADTSMPQVWEVEGSPDETIDRLFSALGGVETLIPKDLAKATVLIKPNICLPHRAETATTTSPDVVEALCDFLVEKGVGRVIIVDHTLQKTRNFDKIALNRIARKYKEAKLMLAGQQQSPQPLQVDGRELKMDKHQEVKLLFANEQRLYQPIEVPGKVLKSTEALKLLSRADLLINLPTAKHHSATGVSLAIKNLMGLIWNRDEFHTRLNLPQAIADLALSIRPGLNIIDASRVLLNGGPVGPGPVIRENRIFAGFDILALDAVVTSRYNFGGKTLSASEVPHLLAAYENGVGEIDNENIRVIKLSA
jgi:uncharacterized protein (DUF362 family)